MTTNNKAKIFYLVFFSVLIIAFCIYSYSIIKRSNNVDKKQLSVVKNFSFVNQNADTITLKDITNKVVIAEFFFTTCKGICPMMNKILKNIYTELNLSQQANFIILSHTVEPENDNIKVLKAYAQKNEIDFNNWHFLTGNKVDLYNQARYSYLLDDPKNNVGKIKDQFIHTQFVALVNQDGSVLRIYDLLINAEIIKLKTDIKNLLKI